MRIFFYDRNPNWYQVNITIYAFIQFPLSSSRFLSLATPLAHHRTANRIPSLCKLFVHEPWLKWFDDENGIGTIYAIKLNQHATQMIIPNDKHKSRTPISFNLSILVEMSKITADANALFDADISRKCSVLFFLMTFSHYSMIFGRMH